MSFIVKTNGIQDFFYITSGGGNSYHQFHPKLLSYEMAPNAHTATDATRELRSHLINGNAPSAVNCQVISSLS